MKSGKVVTLSEYKTQRAMQELAETRASQVVKLPDADHLRELLDRNISLDIWKKGI